MISQIWLKFISCGSSPVWQNWPKKKAKQTQQGLGSGGERRRTDGRESIDGQQVSAQICTYLFNALCPLLGKNVLSDWRRRTTTTTTHYDDVLLLRIFFAFFLFTQIFLWTLLCVCAFFSFFFWLFFFTLPFKEKTFVMHPESGPKFGIPTFQGHVKSTTETFVAYPKDPTSSDSPC